jgi:hypothetical protein
MTVCDVWLARDFLARHGRPVDIPPCTHDPDACPPLSPTPKEPQWPSPSTSPTRSTTTRLQQH